MSGHQRPSLSEEWMWTIEQSGLATSVYNIESALWLRGELNVTAVRDAFTRLVVRHPALRTRFPEGPQGPVRLVEEPGADGSVRVDFEVIEVGREEAVTRAGESAAAPFDLLTGPLMRVRVFRVNAGEHLLVVTVHHMVFDGWSEGILLQEFAQVYSALAEGREPALPELPLQYADFAQWQRERLSGGPLEDLVGYWRDRLSGAGVLDLPVDRPRPAVQRHRGREHRFTLTADLVRKLKDLARAEHTTLFSVLYAAYHVLLTRYTRQNDICVGVPLSNRTHPGSEAVVGLFLNTVVLRPRADDDPAFRELVARVRAEFLDAVDHGDLPFSRLVEELQPERDLSRNPVFQAMFTMAVTEPEPRLARLRVERLRLPARASFMDISAEVRAGGSEAEVSLCADADLFAPSTSAAMAADFERILAAVAQDPDIPLSCAPAPSAAAWLRESPSAAVPDPVAAPGTAAPSPAEAGARQVAAAAVTEVWSRILATPVRGHEDFFELGGTSLLAIRIVSDLRARSIGPVTVRDVFETRTADGLAARLAGRRASEPAPPGPTRLPRHRRALDVPGPDSPQGVK